MIVRVRCFGSQIYKNSFSGANTISAAEHTVALLLATARNVQQAGISLKVFFFTNSKLFLTTHLFRKGAT
jgi:hypothetical protein